MLLGLDFAYEVVTLVGSRMLLRLPGVKSPQDWAVQTQPEEQQEQTQMSELLRSETPWSGTDSTDSSAGDLWLVDQGGLSFLEQVYRLTRRDIADVRPTFIGMEKFDVR